jgi:hypothetical protein
MLRTGFLLWGGWLAVHAVVFSASNGNHAYYMAVIAPALAALAGGGLALFRSEYESAYDPEHKPEPEPEPEHESAYEPEHEPERWSPYVSAYESEHGSADESTHGSEDTSGGRRHMALPAAIVLTVVWALVLDWPTRFVSWLLPIAVMLALCGVAGLWSRGPRTSPRMVHGALAAGIAATLVVPAGWALSSLDPLYAGASTAPIAGPVGNAYYNSVRDHHAPRRIALDRPSARDTALLDYLTKHRRGEKYLLATQTAYAAEPLLRAKSEPVLVMGGFTGNTPFPTTQQLGSLVTAHQVRYALLTTQRPTTAATTWVKSHCTRIPPASYGRRTGGSFTLYDCNRP